MTKPEQDKFDYFLAETKDPKVALDLWLKWKILTDLYFFGTEIMGWKNAKKGRRRRVDPQLHKWLARVLETEDDKLVLIPRLHLKTTWVKLRIVQRILQNPNIRLLLGSTTTRLVEDELKDIKQMFQNPTIMRLFPKIVPPPGKRYMNWERSTSDELTMRRDPALGKPPQEPQIRAVGMGSNITGGHYDEGYFDDPINEDTVKSADLMKGAEDWWAYIQSILEVGAPVCMTGTFYHPNDLYSKLIREGQFKNVFVRRAIENGKPLYASWFTLDDLARIRKRQGDYIFNCQYMLNPLPDEAKMMPTPYPTHSVLPSGRKWRYYIALDPAATTNAWSDESGFAIGAVSDRNELFIEDAFGVKVKGNELIDILIQKHLQYRAEREGVELGLQEHLTSIIQMKTAEWESKSRKSLGMNIVPIKISRTKSKGERINLSLGAALREGKVSINEKCTALMREMEFFTGQGNEKDNLVDAASMLFMVCPTFAQHYWTDVKTKRNPFGFKELFNHRPKGSWEKRFAS